MPDFYAYFNYYCNYYYEYFNDIYNSIVTYDYTQLFGIRDAAIGAAISWAVTIAGLLLLVFLTTSVLIYVFSSVGLFKMAKNLGAAAPGLAFVPIANLYTLGRVAQGPAESKKKFPFGWILLGLFFVANIVSIFSTVTITSTLTEMIMGITYDNVIVSIENLLKFIGGQQLVLCLVSFFAEVLVIVFFYVTLYQVYKVFSADNAPIYITLSVLIPLLIPFYLFAIRNKAAYPEAKKDAISPELP